MDPYEELKANIAEIAKGIKSLAEIALAEYTPVVNEIIALNITDEQRIELVLTQVLDFCFDERILLLYKRLCRHYYFINPKATRQYVYYYFELYEMEQGIE